jgi:hypothetical protein
MLDGGRTAQGHVLRTAARGLQRRMRNASLVEGCRTWQRGSARERLSRPQWHDARIAACRSGLGAGRTGWKSRRRRLVVRSCWAARSRWGATLLEEMLLALGRAAVTATHFQARNDASSSYSATVMSVTSPWYADRFSAVNNPGRRSWMNTKISLRPALCALIGLFIRGAHSQPRT